MSAVEYRKGDKVVITARLRGHQFKIGEVVEIVSVTSREYDAKSTTRRGQQWFIIDQEVTMQNESTLTSQNVANRVAFPIGAKVKVADHYRDIASSGLPRFDVTYTVASCRTTGSGFQVTLEDVSSREFGTDWFVYAETPVTEPIRFSLTKDTSRAYALAQVGRKLKDDSNHALLGAGNGEEVDAFDFRDAVIDALSAATTRSERSPERREYAKQCRHLLYIVNGVIDNAAKNLVPVDPGTKSPRIHELEAQVATLEKEAGSERDYVSQIECLQKINDDLSSDRSQAKAAAQSAEKKVEELLVTLGYVKEMLSPEQQAQVRGFSDGIRA